MAVWKQIGLTPSPLGTGYVARRDMLVAECLHHLEALLNHLTANFVALSSIKEEKKTTHSSKASGAIWKSESLQSFFEEKYSEFIYPLQQAAAISSVNSV